MGGRATTSRLLFAFAMLLAIIMTSQGVHAWYNSIALARHAYYAPSPSFAATTSVQRTSPSSLSTVQSPLSSKQIPKSSSSSSFALGVGNNNNNNNSYEELQSQLPSMGLNELQTQFRQAIAREDMDAAALYRNELADRVSSGAYRSNNNTEEEDVHRKRQRLSWAGLGTAPWLMERLQALEYPLPTTIQINAFEAVNAILADNNNNLNIATHDYSKNGADDDTLEERMQAQTPQNMGVVISGSTGSGKTLAYLVPTLSTLSQTLFTRQRIRITDEEDVDDLMGDLVDRVMVQTSPTVRGQGYEQVGGFAGAKKKIGGGTGGGAALSSLGKSGTDVKSPVALIVVPTRELGVQIALLLFQLVGGNTKSTPTERSGKKNMFRYKGPKGVKIGCVLDDIMSKEGLKLQTDIAITTPQYLSKLIEEKDVDPAKLRVVIYDEADLGLEQTSEHNLKLLFDNNEASNNRREFSRISYLVGATVTESLGNLAVKDEILPEGKSFIATATRFAPLTKEDAGSESMLVESILSSSSSDSASGSSTETSMATLKDLRLCLDPGLCHERVVVSGGTELLCLARMLRKELREYEIASAALAEEKSGSGTNNNSGDDEDAETNDIMKQLAVLREETKDLEEEFGIDDTILFDSSKADSINTLQRPRVVVFFPDEDEARDAIFSLRDAMWGEHKLGVLLPKGEQPLMIMEAFKKGDLSVLLATPNSIRGLDFPALTHVYTLFLPANDPREYLHLAGRVGRIGQQGSVRGRGGRVTTILDESEAPQFDELAEFLGFQYDDVPPIQAEVTEASDVEQMRRYLEDTITLLGTVDDPVVKYASEDAPDVDEDDDTDDDEEDN